MIAARTPIRAAALGLLTSMALLAGPVEDRVRRIEARWKPMDTMVAERVPAVSIAVVRDGQIEWARGYGVATTTGTLFQAASISKPVAAMAALHLVQTGALGLDEDVNTRLKSWHVPENEFTREQKVTLRRLLSHTAGITVNGFPGYGEGSDVPGLLEVLDGKPPANTAAIRVDTRPGQEYRYSGGGYTVLQLLLEDTVGKAFPELMRRLVLQRLNMHTSTYEQPLPAEAASRAAVGFHENGRSYTGGWHVYPEMAAAGLWTTPIDLAKFLIEYQKALGGAPNRVLTPESAKLMVTEVAPHHGTGFMTAGAWFGHSGGNAGYRCQLWGTLDGRHGVIIMTNSDNGGRIIPQIARAIALESGWPAFE